MDKIQRNIIIAVVTVGIIGISLPLGIYLIGQTADTSPVFTFRAEGVSTVNISLNTMKKNIQPYTYNYEFLKAFNGYIYRYNFTGFRLTDVLDYLNFDYGNYTGFRMVANDGYISPYIPIAPILKHPDGALIAYMKDGEPLTPYDPEKDEGDGPFMVVINRSVIYPIPNSQYLGYTVKELNFVFYDQPPLVLTSNVSGVLTMGNITIDYGMLVTSRSATVPKIYDGVYNYTDSSGSYLMNLTGTTLWGIINRTSGLIYAEDSWDLWNAVILHGSDGKSTPPIIRSDFNSDTLTKYIIAWEKNGQILDGSDEGPLIFAVNYTSGDPLSDTYYIQHLASIELVKV